MENFGDLTVVSIEDDGYEDVYDITVDEYHNFALDAGVFVHNSHSKVRNACFEMIQFKALQGIPLPYLELVWGGVNNPDTEMNYAVEEMDPPMVDRFHIYVKMEANPIAEVYASKGIPIEKAKKAIAWWHVLKPTAKRYVTPRRLEYMLHLHMKNIDLKYSLPPTGFYKNIGEVPLNTLNETLNAEMSVSEIQEEYKDYTPDWMKESYQEAIATSYQLDHFFHLVESMKKFTVKELDEVLHVIKKCGPEFQYSLMENIGPKLEKDAKKTKKAYPALFDWLVETRKNHQSTVGQVNPNVQHNVTKATATVNNQGQLVVTEVDGTPVNSEDEQES